MLGADGCPYKFFLGGRTRWLIARTHLILGQAVRRRKPAARGSSRSRFSDSTVRIAQADTIMRPGLRGSPFSPVLVEQTRPGLFPTTRIAAGPQRVRSL